MTEIEQETDDYELLTIGEVAKFFRVDPCTVRRWVKKGALQGVTLPFGSRRRKAYRVRKRAVQDWLEASCSNADH